ncbi:MAG: TonB-dependent receptor [Saprospiraceae bacterium]
MLKKRALLLFIFLYTISLTAQYELTGQIIDIDNNAAIPNVFIINTQDSTTYIANIDGQFKLLIGAKYRFSAVGYYSKEVQLLSTGPAIIQLRPNFTILDEVMVSTNQLSTKLNQAVSTINIIPNKVIQRKSQVNMAAVLNTIPGLYMHTGALNTNRITIRGIGSRNLYGTSKIRAYFGDIPLTTGSGETNIEEFELKAIGRIEIIKGANSSIYGAGLGGAIHMMPNLSYLKETSIKAGLSIGSFGLRKGYLDLNISNAKHGLKILYSDTHIDGYRDNNKYDRQTVTLSSNHYINAKNEITVLGNYTNLKAQIPSSIDEEKYISNPKSAAFTWAKSQGKEDVNRGLLGVSWKHKYSDQIKHFTSVFTSYRNSDEDRPFNILEENTFAFGMRSRVIGKNRLFKRAVDWTIGGELFFDNHKSKTFINLYKDYPQETGSVKGTLLTNYKELRKYSNLFFESIFHISDRSLVTFGVNYNKTSYTLTDKNIGNNNQSGDYEFDGIISPKIGVSHQLFDNVYIYSNISQGFSPPSITETLLPDGKINTEIQPEIGWNYEIGSRGKLFSNKVYFNVALFFMDIDNLLIAKRLSEDQYIGVNAGNTHHKGLELSISSTMVENELVTINGYLTYTLNNFYFNNFVDSGNDYSGNQLTGVPSNIMQTGIDVSSKSGIYGHINYQYISSMPITDSNSLYSDSYKIANVKIGYKYLLSDKISVNIYTRIGNVFNEKYASQILINAKGFGGKEPRYYYPGNPINYYSGLTILYNVK